MQSVDNLEHERADGKSRAENIPPQFTFQPKYGWNDQGQDRQREEELNESRHAGPESLVECRTDTYPGVNLIARRAGSRICNRPLLSLAHSAHELQLIGAVHGKADVSDEATKKE